MVDAPPSIPLPTCMVEAAQIYHIPLRGFLALWLTEGGKPGMKIKTKRHLRLRRIPDKHHLGE